MIELDGVTADILWIGDHPANVLAYRLAEVAFPFPLERFGAGNYDFIRCDLHRENAMALCEGVGHHPRDGRRVDLERVYMVVVLTTPARKPMGQPLQIKSSAVPLAGQCGNCHQFKRVPLWRMAGTRGGTEIGRQYFFSISLGDLAAFHQR